MVVTTTAIAFILLSIGLAFCGWRFFRAFKADEESKTNNRVGLLIGLYFVGFSIQNAILGLGTLFFTWSQVGLFSVLVTANIFLILVALFGTYVVYYIFLPKSSPWPAIIVTSIVGIISMLLAISTHPQPFVTAENGIDWGMSFSLSLSVFYLLFISIGASLYIFARLFFQAKNKEIKFLSFLLAIAAIGGIVDAFIRFVLLRNAQTDIRTQIYDIGIGIISLAFIATFFLFSHTKNKISVNKSKTSQSQEEN